MEPFNKESIFSTSHVFISHAMEYSGLRSSGMLCGDRFVDGDQRFGTPVIPIFKGQAVTSQKSEDFNYPAVEASNLAFFLSHFSPAVFLGASTTVCGLQQGTIRTSDY